MISQSVCRPIKPTRCPHRNLLRIGLRVLAYEKEETTESFPKTTPFLSALFNHRAIHAPFFFPLLLCRSRLLLLFSSHSVVSFLQELLSFLLFIPSRSINLASRFTRAKPVDHFSDSKFVLPSRREKKSEKLHSPHDLFPTIWSLTRNIPTGNLPRDCGTKWGEQK